MMILSREIIKPSSPTPTHLHTYNLSELDQLGPNFYIPLVLFYPNNGDTEEKANTLKKTLSQILTQYYPFSGRLPTPSSPYIDCNDAGVLFLEARNESQLDTFQRLTGSYEETLDQLFADDLVLFKNVDRTYPVAIQLTHFACGGLALAISLAHAIGDACTLSSFLSHWASLARYGSIDHLEVISTNPHYIQSPRTQIIQPQAGTKNRTLLNNLVSRKLVFSNLRISELKKKVDGSINNPTRVEVLISLLYKTAIAAAIEKSGSFNPSYLISVANVRDKFMQKLPRLTVGNFLKPIIIERRHTNEASISMVTEEIRKSKLQLNGIQSVQALVDSIKSFHAKLINEDLENFAKGSYWCTSLCGFNFNKVDFGWGKPMGTAHELRFMDRNGFVLMDTPGGDGIEVMMFLEKDTMEIFENDKEMLLYCQFE